MQHENSYLAGRSTGKIRKRCKFQGATCNTRWAPKVCPRWNTS